MVVARWSQKNSSVVRVSAGNGRAEYAW